MKSQIKKKIEIANKNKIIFTAGPASLAAENLNSLKPCFGRGDREYTSVENFVLSKILKMSGQKKIARLQGSGSLAIEIMCLNLLNGKILIIYILLSFLFLSYITSILYLLDLKRISFNSSAIS